MAQESFSGGSHSPPLKGRGRGGVCNFFRREEQTIKDSLKDIRDPTPTPPLERRGKATGRRPKVGRSTSGRLLPKGRKNAPSGKANSDQQLYCCFFLIVFARAREGSCKILAQNVVFRQAFLLLPDHSDKTTKVADVGLVLFGEAFNIFVRDNKRETGVAHLL